MNEKNKKISLIIMIIVLIVVLIAGISYALWQLTFTQTGTNVITTGCLSLTLTEDTDAINLINATPISDEEGKKLTPFSFTLENTCTTETSYVVNLETLSSEDKILSNNYVRANLTAGSSELFLDNLLETHINEEKVLEEAVKAYKLYQGSLGSKEKISFNLKIWMDEQTNAIDEVMNATWQGKITITARYIPPVDTKNMMVPMTISGQETPSSPARGHEYNSTYTRGTKYDNLVYNIHLTKVVFEDTLNPYENAEEIVDFSLAQDKSVLGYYVPNENSRYYTLIQANGKIKVNPIASYYGLIYDGTDVPQATIEGIENLDTSLVTNMSYMFKGSDNTTLDLSNFDTTNVENYQGMFSNASVSTIIYGAKFIYRNNANITGMFDRCNATKPTHESWNGLFS